MLKALALALVVAPQLASAQAPSDQACVADIDGDGGVNVNDLLKLLGQFGSAGVDGEDLDGDGTVNVNDLLQLLSNFGTDTSACTSSVDIIPDRARPAPTEMCPDSPPQRCRALCPAELPTCAAGQCAMRQGSCCDLQCVDGGATDETCSGCCPANARCFAPDPPCCANRVGGVCAQGEDCGGQERTDCGTPCPKICGEPVAEFCAEMCVSGYQCPRNLFWDGGAGQCVEESACSAGGAVCAQGEDCGGQERTECGTPCPAICGQPPAQICVAMCVIGFQCPRNQHWDGEVGRCVEESACTTQFSLPPGLALGRPFLPAEYDPSLPNTKVVPTVASAMELMSDWVVEL